MSQLDFFWSNVKLEKTAHLATSADNNVTMRTVSPVYYKDAILIFANAESQKYKQLEENPNCCVAIAGFFMKARAEFLGHTMSEDNAVLRNLYAEKFADAFTGDAEIAAKSSAFILLKPVQVAGWRFENGTPAGHFVYLY